MLVVLDTNVLVSALLKRNSPPGKILNVILEGKLRIAINEQIISEYNTVLYRPRLKIPPENAEAILRLISQFSLWMDEIPFSISQDPIIDPDDLPFAEVAICSQAEALITGNMKHFKFLQAYPVKVLLPQEFIKEYDHLF